MRTVASFAREFNYDEMTVRNACEKVGVEKWNGKVVVIPMSDVPLLLDALKHYDTASTGIDCKNVTSTEYLRQYREKNSNRINARRRVWLNSRYNEYGRKWMKENPEKARAHAKLFRLVKKGVIVRTPCAECDEEKVISYLQDYSDVHSVVWLCRRCHYKAQHGLLSLEDGGE